MLRRVLLIALCSMSSFFAHAGGLDINVSADTLKIAYGDRLTNNTYWGASYMNTDDADVIKAGVSTTGVISNSVKGSIGVNAVLIKNNSKITATDDSGGVVTLTGSVTYRNKTYNRFAATVAAEYGPEVATFGEVEEYSEASAKISYRVLDNGAVYVGYRHARVDYGSSSQTLDNGIIAGYQMAF